MVGRDGRGSLEGTLSESTFGGSRSAGAEGAISETFGRPHPALLAVEALRAVGEMAWCLASIPVLGKAPRGDGHPVVVLPGFAASDNSTKPLRAFLRGRGYHVHGWRLGINVGPTDRVLDGMAARLRHLHDLHGRAMSLIGWSLGGIYAREIAREAPEVVRRVITLGSPFRLTDREESYASPLYNALSTFHSTRVDEPRLPESSRPPIKVPVTNIFSRTDGVAPWRSCMDEPGPLRENIEVVGSHCGFGHNPAVLRVIADRLAQPEGQWAPFEPTGAWALLYPARAA